MALQFPQNPTNGQTYTVDNTTWIWDGDTWNIQVNTSPTFTTITATNFIGNGSQLTNISYNNLADKPTIPSLGGYATENFVGSAISSALTGDSSGGRYVTQSDLTWSNIASKPVLFSGSYNDLTDKPTIPSLTGYATESYVTTAISNVIDAAPAALDTLNELAAALGDDSNFASTVATSLALKAPLANPTFNTGISLVGGLIPYTTGSLVNSSNSVQITSGDDGNVAFSTDGTRMFVVSRATNDAFQYNLATAWNVSTATLAYTLDLSSYISNEPRDGVFFRSNGTEFFVIETVSGGMEYKLSKFTLATPWTLSSVTGKTISTNTVAGPNTGWTMSSDGANLYVLTSGIAYQYTMSVPWDITTLSGSHVYSYDYSADVPSPSYPSGMAFSNNGSVLQLIYNYGQNVYEVALSTPYRINAVIAGSSNTFPTGFTYTSTGGITWGDNGTKLYAVGSTNFTDTFVVQLNVGSSPALMSFDGKLVLSNNNTRLVITSTQTTYNASTIGAPPVDLSPSAYASNYTAVNIAPPVGEVRIAPDNGRLTLDCDVTWGQSNAQFDIFGYGQINFDSSVGAYRGIMKAFDIDAAKLTGVVNSSDRLETKTSATGVVIHDFSSTAIWYHSSISANFTANFTNVPTTNNRTIVCTLILEQSATGYVANAVQINGSSQAIKWYGGSAPSGTANKVEILTFTLVRANNAWTVFGSLSSYG